MIRIWTFKVIPHGSSAPYGGTQSGLSSFDVSVMANDYKEACAQFSEIRQGINKETGWGCNKTLLSVVESTNPPAKELK